MLAPEVTENDFTALHLRQRSHVPCYSETMRGFTKRLSPGFTIVELLVVIVVIAILASISVVSYNGITTRAKATQVATDLRNITTALQEYQIENNGLPCFDHLWNAARETAWSAPYLTWPTNPAGGPYHWEHNVGGTTSVSISMQNLGTDIAQAADTMMDDGNLSTGTIKGNGSRLEYFGMEQTPTSHPGDDC